MKLTRVIGIDDGDFRGRKKTPLVAVLMRESTVEGVAVREITVHGSDATDAVLDILKNSRFAGQPRILFTNGLALAGTNVIDFERLFDETGVALVSATRRVPSSAFFDVLEKRGKRDFRKKAERLGYFFLKGIHVQYYGVTESTARKALEKYQISSLLPEPVRLAHLIATALTLGDSRGYA